MHINKNILYKELENFIKEKYHESDKELILNLCKQIIFNEPTKNCIIKGKRTNWYNLPKTKNLFHTKENTGLPIGNLTSQVFANLISNGIKYHDREDGKIQVTVHEVTAGYEFAVSDDGPGIKPEYHEKIFTIFQTLEARDTYESTGIGLTIVKKIIEEQGGDISLESGLGQGSTFRFIWPLYSVGRT